MKISLKWLNDYIEISDYYTKPNALADLLTQAGLEVEDITNHAKTFNQVVVGLILEKGKHPNADKLSLCQVTTGEGVVHQIVCGAQNHKQNDKVVVALPGAVLPGNFEIKQSQIRGVTSGGMLCSYKELGLAGDNEGIIILPEESPLGGSFAKYMGLDDIVFELKVTPNRSDCLSHYGLAREISCLLDRPLKDFPQAKLESHGSTQDKIQLEVRDNKLCPRYTGAYIEGLKVSDSPQWLRQRLELVGLNSINNIVDITNYVMMELGQPLHAFDADKIAGKKVIIDKAQTEEKFITLDGTELKLQGEELMIKDSQKSMCIGGVIGGKESGVSEQTQNIFLESAFFAPDSVRKSLRKHGLNTDSGYRFSRGVDIDGARRALDRACQLIVEHFGGRYYGSPYDIFLSETETSKVLFGRGPIVISLQTVSDRLGYEAKSDKLESYFKRLKCLVETESPGIYKITPPSFRFDLETDMDLVEEYARLDGYDKIPEKLPVGEVVPTAHDAIFTHSQKLSRIMRGLGYDQAVNIALTKPAHENKLLGEHFSLGAPIKLLNPLSDDWSALKRSLSPALLKNGVDNFHRGNHQGRLFEVGKVFYKKEDGTYLETWRLGILAWGHKQSLWQKSAEAPLVYELKSSLHELLGAFAIKNVKLSSLEHGQRPEFLHPNQSAQVTIEAKVAGYLGTVHPSFLEENKVRVEMAYMDLDLGILFQGQPRLKRIEPLSKYPAVERDLALLIPKGLEIGSVLELMQKELTKWLVSLDVFDVYSGGSLEPGQRSVAFRVVLQDRSTTLQDSDVNGLIESCLKALKEKFNISVR